MSAGTVIVAAVIIGAVILAIRTLLRDRCAGKNACGCNCRFCTGCSKPIRPKE